MYQLIRRVLFMLPAEMAHTVSMSLLRFACRIPLLRNWIRRSYQPNASPLSLWNIRFRNPVGLAAGFDKNAKYLRELETLGFGHVEIGTVTPLPQPGNPKPRLFRLPEDKALINRMGFNNDGAAVIAERLRKWRIINPTTSLVVGGNIGKNKLTPNESAWEDYVTCFHALHPYVDYFTINVSSPNTPGLRSLQEPEQLKKIICSLQQVNRQYASPRPILLKVAPDLETEAMNEVIDLAMNIGLDGLVLANTTLSREGLQTSSKRVADFGAGGLSGAPLTNRCAQWISHAHQRSNGKLPIIASGGIFGGADAKCLLDAGASMIQVWTGFVYEGPGIVKNICKSLS
ncbi:MAG: quinone-dependent dihydroorotate dehydrogenase [Bacteroidota bacterium]